MEFISYCGFLLQQGTKVLEDSGHETIPGPVDSIGNLFKVLVLVAICIAISAKLLGYIFQFKDREENHLKIPIPGVLALKTSGTEVFAGFTIFVLSVFVVGAFFSEYAKVVFIENLDATQEQWEAGLFLAGIISVCLSLLLSCIYSVVSYVLELLQSWELRSPFVKKESSLSDQERVDRLVSGSSGQTQNNNVQDDNQ